MVKEFLKKKSKQLLSKFIRKSGIEKIHSLINEIEMATEIGDTETADREYSKLEHIYKKLKGHQKKAIFPECAQVHNKINKKKKQQKVDFKELDEEEKKTPIQIKKREFLKTMVPGFDDLIEEGIPFGSNILVSGNAGSGKTTFTSQLLMNNALQGKKCLYMSFEESQERLMEHLTQYGWEPQKAIEMGTLVIRQYDPFMISRSIEALLAEARGELVIQIDKTKGLIPDDYDPDIVVVDSLSAIAAAFTEQEAAYRIYIEQLFRSFENLGITSFLIAECDEGTTRHSKTGVEEFLADGVIGFYNMKRGNSRISATEVVKMRGTAHKKKVVPFSFIKGKGIEVYPLQEIFME